MMMLQKCGSDAVRCNIEMNSKSMVLQRKMSCDQSHHSEKSTKSLPAPTRRSLIYNPSFITSSDIIQPPPNFSNPPSNLQDELSSSRSFTENSKSHLKRSCTPSGLELEYEQTSKRILEEEVVKLKSELSSLSQRNEMSISINNEFKIQNEKMKIQVEEINGKLSDMAKEKDYLCKCLERERESTLSRNSEKTNGIQPKVIDEYKEEIRTLKESLLMLSKKLQEKDLEKQNVTKRKDKLELKLKRQKETNKKITEINQKLSNSIKIKHENFTTLRNKNNKCEKELERYKSNLSELEQELEKLKQELENEREKTNKIPEKLNVLKDKEQQSQNEIIHWRSEVENLTKTIKKYQENEDSTSAIKRQNQLCVTTSAILRNKSNELQRIVDEQRRKIEELEFIQQHQDIVISSQNEQLLSKDEQIKLQEQENDIVKEKCLQLDKQLEIVRNMMETREVFEENQSNSYQKICQLEHKIEELKSTLEREREKQNAYHQEMVKEKMNEAENIKKMSSALEISKEKLEMAIRELDREKENAKVMVNGLEKLTIRKEKLEEMMLNLEGSCNGLLIEKDRYAKLCDELQKELVDERKIRVYERAALVDERNRAFEVARMAAVTLIETVEDYEVVTKAQMEAKKSISNLVKNKQKRRPGCPPVPSGRPKNSSNENELVSENLFDSPEDVMEDVSTSEGTDNKQETNCNFTPGVIETEGVLGIQIPMAVLNPYAAAQSTLIPTTSLHNACWFRNCGYQPNQVMCNVANPYQLASCSNNTNHQYPNQCQFGIKYNSLQKNPSEIRPPVKVASKKSTNSDINRNKRSR